MIRAAGQSSTRVETRHAFPEAQATGADEDDAPTFQEAARRFQRGPIEEALAEADWNVSEAARRLDLARSHVYELVKVFELMPGGSKSK